MTSSPSGLSSGHEVLVVDASVMINLLGTGKPADLLRILSRKILMDEFALKEVTSDPFSKTSGQKAMQTLLESALIDQVRLSNSAFGIFLNLTAATPPDDLGDGEAATIAQALDVGAIPVIDERKATRIVLSMEPKRPVLNTIDIFGCSEVANALPERELGDLIYYALLHARMRVPVTCRDWVSAMIGPERVRDCPSLGFVKGYGGR
jgi:predicted nucleic acid-binding protein